MFRTADAILRSPLPLRPDGSTARGLLAYLPHILAFGLLYGAAMGTFSGFTGERMLQVVYSGVKVPLLLLVTFFIALPSFFVLNTLMGLRADFTYVLRALMATQAGLTIVLCSLFPLTLLWYRSSDNYNAAILFNALMFAVASIAAQGLMRRYYRPLIARSARHRTMLRAWLLIYAFVGIQMGWVLRPFIGDPTGPTEFFRQGAWGNAYIQIIHIATRAVK